MNIWDRLEDEPCSEANILLAEKHFGVQLPAEYKEALRQQNGGYLKNPLMPCPKELSEDEFFFVESLYGIHPGKQILNVMETENLMEEWGIPKEKFVFIAGDGHWFLALYYGENLKEPEIYFIDNEDHVLYPLYKSFSSMTEYLHSEE